MLSKFTFPEEAEILTKNLLLRHAIFEVYGGKCFYSGKDITMSEMEIDHIIPSCKGGRDNIFNYVPTTKSINSTKNGKFNPEEAMNLLSLVKSEYAHKVMDFMVRHSGKDKAPFVQVALSFPRDVHRSIKIEAAKAGISIKDWVIKAVNAQLAREGRKDS